MTLNIYMLVLSEELLLEALFSMPVFLSHPVASLQAVQKCLVDRVGTFGVLASQHCWFTGSGLFLDCVTLLSGMFAIIPM